MQPVGKGNGTATGIRTPAKSDGFQSDSYTTAPGNGNDQVLFGTPETNVVALKSCDAVSDLPRLAKSWSIETSRETETPATVALR